MCHQGETAALTARTARQTKAAVLRAARVTETLRRYRRGSEHPDIKAWRVFTQKYVELGETCCNSGCDNPAVARTAVNVWGSLYEIDVCEKHQSMAGKWVDSF